MDPSHRRYRIFRTPRFSRRFSRETGASLFPGNGVTLLRNGEEFFCALLSEIRNARHLITLEFYIIRNDASGCALEEALLEAAARGVRVYLLYDYIGCIETDSEYFRRLRAGSIECIPFNPLSFRRLLQVDRRNHRKVAIIDGRRAFLGGINIGEEYVAPDEERRWRDFGLLLEGPAVAELQRSFREIWEAEGATPPPDGTGIVCYGDAEVMIVNGTPHRRRSFIRSAFQMAVAGASSSIRVLNPYFVPGPRFVRALLRAARRGVKVQIVLPAVSDVPLVRLVSRSYFLPLLKEGVELYERQGTVLHGKLMLIDDCWAIAGSANLDLRSFHRNYEVNVIIDSHDFGKQVEDMFEEDLAGSRRITLEEHEARRWYHRLLEAVCSPISRFL